MQSVREDLDSLRREVESLRRRERVRNRVALAVVLAAGIVTPMAVWAPVPHTFSDGTVASATQVNENFAAVLSAIPTIPATPTLSCTCSTAATSTGCGVNDVTATLAAGYTRTGGGC